MGPRWLPDSNLEEKNKENVEKEKKKGEEAAICPHKLPRTNQGKWKKRLRGRKKGILDAPEPLQLGWRDSRRDYNLLDSGVRGGLNVLIVFNHIEH